jgi:hypothetical protein
MSDYIITEYSKNQAQRLGVIIKQSSNPKKKIDVFNKDGELLHSIGDIKYMDYPKYLKAERAGKVPKGTANRNRYLYKKRHEKDRVVKGSAGYYADNILW